MTPQAHAVPEFSRTPYTYAQNARRRCVVSSYVYVSSTVYMNIYMNVMFYATKFLDQFKFVSCL